MTQPELMRLSALISDNGIRKHLLHEFSQMTPEQKENCIWVNRVGMPSEMDFPKHFIQCKDSIYATNAIWVLQEHCGCSQTVTSQQGSSGFIRTPKALEWNNRPENRKPIPADYDIAVMMEFGIHKRPMNSYGVRFHIFRRHANSRLLSTTGSEAILKFVTAK